MQIAFLIGNLSNSGGTQRMLSVLCNELIGEYSICIFIHKEGEPFFHLDERINIHLLKGNLWKKNLQLYKKLKSDKTAFYINLDSNSVLLNGFLLPRFTRLIMWEHFSLENNRKSLLFYLSRRYASIRAYKWVVLSHIEKELWQKKYQLSPAKINVIYNPVTFGKNIDTSHKQHRKKVLAIGNNNWVKGFDLLVEAWKGITTNEWELQIVGLPRGEKEKLQKTIDIQRIKRIQLISRVKNIAAYYKDSSIFVLSSRKEATPLVLIESQAYGLPVIAFDQLSSVREIAQDSIIYSKFEDLNNLTGKLNLLMESETVYNDYHQRALQNSKTFSIINFRESWKKVLSETK